MSTGLRRTIKGEKIMADKKPNILMVAIDSLLSTHMSCYGYGRQTTPHMDKFAKQGTLFENTFSPHVPTTPGYASMLTGMDCFGTDVVALRHKGPLLEEIQTLPEVLAGVGYSTTCVGFTGNPASRGFENYLDYKAWGSAADGTLNKAEALNEVFIPELDRLAADDKPFFAMLRHMDPHSPYLPPSPFDRIFYHGDPCEPTNKSMEPVMSFAPFSDYFTTWMPVGVTDKDYIIASYDGAIAYMDACIQLIFEQLETLGILDETIVVINSDHGETLYDHECWFDHHGIYDVTLRVPLIIRYPDKIPAGTRVTGYNQHKDLMPTILELADIDSDIKFDGESLTQLISGKKTSFESEIYITECTWMRKHGWRTPEWKLMVALEPDFHFKPEVELYNLIIDPDENTNVAEENPDIVATLRARIDKFVEMREKQTGRPNPMFNQPGWHGKEDIDYFTSSQQAYDTLHIGDAVQAQKLQADAKKEKE
jgi:arylsulfatase A-like enzyme